MPQYSTLPQKWPRSGVTFHFVENFILPLIGSCRGHLFCVKMLVLALKHGLSSNPYCSIRLTTLIYHLEMRRQVYCNLSSLKSKL